jgi:hypothetical protein
VVAAADQRDRRRKLPTSRRDRVWWHVIVRSPKLYVTASTVSGAACLRAAVAVAPPSGIHRRPR